MRDRVSRAILMTLQQGVEKLDVLAKETRRDPSAENVHRLRVLTRRVRSLLWYVPKTSMPKSFRKLRDELKDLAAVLGEKRMYDVAIEDSKALQLNPKSLKKEARGTKAMVKKAVKKKRIKSYEKTLRKAADKAQSVVSVFPSRIIEIRNDLREAISNPPELVPERHDLRIHVKRARYLLQSLNEEVPALEKLQDHLGKWHDIVVLEELIGKSKKTSQVRNDSWEKARAVIPSALSRACEALDRLTEEALM